jgi:photosystem II stability/assembly factor-like uncharacterized protein
MHRFIVCRRPLVGLLAVLTALVVSHRGSMSAQESLRPSAETDALSRLRWRELGPTNQAGRVSVFVGVPGDPYTMYVSGANGGVFKSTNGGITWKGVFEDQAVLSIGDVAIAPSNPNVLYVGTGEGNPRNNASFGNGVYRSNDGGETWTHLGLEDTDRIARIRIDSRNANIAYVCALGREWGPNEQRGVFKTSDGGRNWQKVLYKDTTTGCSDIDINPDNSSEIYAGMYSYLRQAWHLRSGGGETALYKSMDGGATWKKLTNGIPQMLDRIGVSISRSSPNIVYMVSETPDYQGELWRTDDSGRTWRVVSKDPNINFRPFYYADIRVDPVDPNRVYALSGSLYLTEDAGRTFRTIGRDVHGDHQALWIDPLNPRRLLSGSDGGFQISNDRGTTFEVLNNVAFTQFYHIHYDMQRPYNICGGLQDNGTWCGPSNSLLAEGIRKNDWYTVGGGDGFFAVPDVAEPWRVYTDLQGGVISVIDTRTGAQRTITPYPNRVGSVGDAMENHKYRFNWDSPIELSPRDPKTVYFGGNVLFRTTNAGQSWEVISPDLTTNDRSKQKSSGEPIVVDNTAAEFHCTIIAIAPSRVNPNVIWVGTDDGNVQVTKNGGKTWANVVKNIPGLAPFAWIPNIDASWVDAGTAYVAADHHRENDYAPYFYKTTDYGQTWTKLNVGTPARAGWSHVIREDPKNRNVLYAGTELGIWVSFDGGGRWTSLRNNMPPAPVRDIRVHPRDNDLIAATHGRGVYIMDRVTALQQIGDALKTDAFLFDVAPATRWTVWNRDANLGQKVYKAPNPPQGALFDYYLKGEQKGDVVISIADKSGTVVRTLRNLPRADGVNRTTWDLRYDGPRQQPGASRRAIDEEDAEPVGRFGGAGGPYVLPGDYTVKMSVGGKELTRTVKVDMDPRTQVSMADLTAQLEAGLALRDLANRVTTTVDRTNDLIQQLTQLAERVKPGGPDAAAPNAKGAFELANGTIESLQTLRDEQMARPVAGLGYRQYPRLREEVQSVFGMVTRPPTRPTDGQALRLKELTEETEKVISALNRIITDQVGRLNQTLANMPRISAEPVR